MPQPAGLGGFVQQEWARFWQAWDSLDPTTQAQLEGQRQSRQGATGGQPTINVPGWDDFVHVKPAYQPTREERQEYQKARSEGRPPLLTPDAVAGIERQNSILDRIANSAQPGYSQAFGQMMTSLDNIQDAISTAATLGRIAVWPALGTLARLSPELAAKAGARLIPGLGWILGAADLLNLLTWLGMGGLIGYGLLCGGGAGLLPPLMVQAATRGIPLGRPCTMRGAVNQVAETNPFAAKNLLKNSSKAAKKFPGFGKWLEVAQTTDQLWGRGLSFGAGVGTVMEAAYAAFGATQGAGIRVNPPSGSGLPVYRGPAGGTLDYGTARALLEVHAPRAARARLAGGPGELRAKWQLARVMMDAPALLLERSALSMQDVAGILCAWWHANDQIRRDLAGADVDGMLADLAELELSPVVTTSAGVQALLSERPDAAETVGRWPLPGAPRAVRGAELLDLWADQLPGRVAEWLEPRRNDVGGMWLGGVINETAMRSWQTITGELEPFRTRYEPDFVILTSLTGASRFPDVSAGERALWAWWTELREKVTSEERGSLLPRELDESANRHAITLFYAEQPFLRASALG